MNEYLLKKHIVTEIVLACYVPPEDRCSTHKNRLSHGLAFNCAGVKTYTFEDGTVEEGIVTITRNADILEGMKPYLEYDQETEDVRTVTVVTNPGTENEKIDNVKVPKGVPVTTSCDWDSLEYYTI